MTVKKGTAAYKILRRAVQQAQVLWAKARDDNCKYTLFCTEGGLPSDCSARLIKLLREVLVLGDGVTGTSLRRAVVDKVMRDDSIPEQKKKGARRSTASAQKHRISAQWRCVVTQCCLAGAPAAPGGTQTR